MIESSYPLIESGREVPIKDWTREVPREPKAQQQLCNVAYLPISYKLGGRHTRCEMGDVGHDWEYHS